MPISKPLLPTLGLCLAAIIGIVLQGGASTAVSNWRPLGPVNMPTFEPSMGRVNFVTVNPTNSQVLFACSASGGLWASADGGQTWQPRTDYLSVLGTSGAVIDPQHPNVMYLATGDADAGNTPSIGVWKSTDGGMNWSATGLAWPENAYKSIYRLVMHPADPSKLFAATSDGIYSSTNGAATWQRQTPGSQTLWYDVGFKPGNPATLYAISQQAIFYRSIDTGASWQPLGAGLPAPSSVSRSALAVSAANPQGVYLLCTSAADYGLVGLYGSTNGGTSFVQRASSATPVLGQAFGHQGYYDTTVAASPADFNQVYVGGLSIARSGDGGTTWTNVQQGSSSGYCHVDCHALQFFGSTLYACTDGGLHRTSDGAANWVDLSLQLQIAQLYRVGSALQDPNLIYVGAQDNGLNQYLGGQWSHRRFGDASESVVDFVDENIVYAVINGGVYKTTDGWGTSTNLTVTAGENNFFAPIAMHPTDRLTLYAGFANVHRTSDGGATWHPLSSFADATTLCGRIVPAVSNPNYIYVTRGTNLWRTSDGGLNWTNVTHNIPGAWPLSSVTVSSSNATNVWVTANNAYNSGGKVFHSTNGGDNWFDYSGSLPAVPANTLAYEGGSNDGLYVGMEPGVYYRDGSMADWQPFVSNLPNVKISELEVHLGSLQLRAATFGRGLWATYLAGAAPQPPVISGLSVVPTNHSTTYTFTPVTKAIGYQWRQQRLVPFNLLDGAETGLSNFTAVASTNYSVVQNGFAASGSNSFHLAHGQPAIDQILTLNAALRARTNAQVQFKSLLGYATPTQIAKVQVSTNDGGSWQDVYTQPGTGGPGDGGYNTRTVSLTNYAGLPVEIRFDYVLGPGSYFPQTSSGVGWYLDDITFSGFDRLTNATMTDIPGTNFNFTAAQTNDYLLDARAKVFGPYYLEFGPAKLVSVVATPVVQITGLQKTATNTWNIDFTLLGGPVPAFQLYQADLITGPWTQDTAAKIQTIIAGSTYRTVTTNAVTRRYYRIRAQ